MHPLPGIYVRVYVSEDVSQGTLPTPEGLLTIADGVLGPYEAVYEQATTSYLRHYLRLKRGLKCE